MRLTTKSEYALVCLKAVCSRSANTPISVGELSEREQMPKDYIEQILIKLREAGIMQSVKGVNGGYLMMRSPSQVTLKEVIEAVEGNVYEVFCEPSVRERIVCTHYKGLCSVRPVWERLQNMIEQFFASITLDALLLDEQTLEKRLQGIQVA
jgi:Rrf2 family protein